MFAISQLFLVTCVAKGIDCPSGDGVAHLQAHHGRALANGVKDPCLADINTGVCQLDACTGCDGGATIPTNASRFPTGSLLCEITACNLDEASNPPYTFADANDFLECENGACFGWKVENVGALCCFGGGSCQKSNISLASTGSCAKDVCCRGQDGCRYSSLQGVKSLSCTQENEEDEVCNDMKVDLAGDVYCKGLYACDGALVNFGPGEHCVWCLDDACSKSVTRGVTGVFASSGSSYVFCSAKNDLVACDQSTWSIPAGQSVRFYCEGEDNCENIEVDLSGTLDLICNGTDVCLDTVINILRAGALCNCTALNGGVCPDNCKDDVIVNPPSRCLNQQQEHFHDTACCAGAGGCEDCGCEVTTSAASTTTNPRRRRRDNGQRPRHDAKEGTVSLWHFGGMDKETKSAHDLQEKQPVDLNIYAHGAVPGPNHLHSSGPRSEEQSVDDSTPSDIGQ